MAGLGGRGDLARAERLARCLQRPAPDAAVAFVRICSHYFSHGAWLEEGELLANAGRLAGIPGVLLHGRHDLGSPLGTAWELAQAWPGSELVVVDDSGHTGSDAMRRLALETTERFAR